MRVAIAMAALVLSCPAWGARTLRVFGPAGFEDGDPGNDCPIDAISPSALEAKFLRRTGAAVVCMQPSPELCFNNDCNGTPGCPVPVGPLVSAAYRIDLDRVETVDRIGRFSGPVIVPIVGPCTVTIDPGSASVLVQATHVYDVQPFGLDGLGVVGHPSHFGLTVTGLSAAMVSLSGNFGCVLANVGVGFFVGALQDSLGPSILALQDAEASDVPGSVVCPVAQP